MASNEAIPGQEDEEKDGETGALDEDLVFTILTFAALLLCGAGLGAGGVWWSVFALYLPGMAVGQCIEYPKLTRADRFSATMILVIALALIFYGVVKLESARPLWRLLVLVIGLGHGTENQKKKNQDEEESALTS